MTTDLNPIGLPPINNRELYSCSTNGLNKNNFKESLIERKNKNLIKKIQRLKKVEKALDEEEHIKELNKKSNAQKNLSKTNKDIEEIRKELYNISSKNDKDKIVNNSSNEDTQNSIIKLNPKYHNFKEKLEEAQEKDLNELVSFAQNLDYDKYLKDLEIREALNLIKIRVDEDKQKEDEENNLILSENINEENNNPLLQEELILPSIIKNQEDNEKNKESNLQIEEINHDRNWNVS